MNDKYSLDNWVDDLDLVCRHEWEVGIIGSSCFAGMFIGALTLSPISDIYGRRPVHIIGLVLSLIGGLWMYVFPTWISVIISLLLKGIGMYSRLSISYLYTLEMFDEERCKVIATIIMSINNALSSVMALYFMFGGRDATFFLLCSIFIAMYSLVFIPILPESPKLLFSQKDYAGTRDCLESIAHVNGIKYKKQVFKEEVENHQLLADCDPKMLEEIERENIRKADFKQLCTKPQFLINLSIIVFVFMINVFSMYMLSFMLKYLPGDKYVNLFMLGVADFIPSVMSGLVLVLMPTKRAMILTHLFICVFVVLHIFFGGIEYLGMPLIFFIRFAITLQSCLNFYIVYELFPAKFASVVYGG
jgi:MFS family permease